MSAASTVRITDPIDRLDEAMGRIAAASADALEAIWDCHERGLWRRDGATSVSSWLAARYGLAWGTAREWLRVAGVVKDLPRLFRTYRSGRISWDQLRPLTRFITAETEEYWSRRAGTLRPATLWREARRRSRATTREAEEAHRRRYLELWWDPEQPVLYLQGQVGSEQGAALEIALTRAAEQVGLADDPEDPAGARMADALVELVTEPKAGTAPGTTLVLHAGAEVLAGARASGAPMLAETESGHQLPAEAIRRLACDARIEWVLELDGRPVGIGRRGRAVPGTLLRVLRHRDGGSCRFPGCERKRWLHAHHLLHWADGGPTNLDNLVLLCHAHHRLLHESGWRVSGHPARDLRFHDPGGRPVRTMPHAAPSEVGAPFG